MGGGSIKNRLNSSRKRRRTRKQDRHLLFSPICQIHGRNRGGRRAIKTSGRLQSGEPYGSVNVRLHVHIISSSIRYRRSGKESKKDPRMGKALILPTSIRERTRMSRTPGPSEGFGTQDGVYCQGCRGSIKSLLRRKPPTVLLLFQRTPL